MDKLQQKIVSLVEGAGGSIVYADLLKAMDAFERQSLRRSLVALKADGVLRAVVAWNAETSTISHTYQLVRG